jgi:glutaredoxin
MQKLEMEYEERVIGVDIERDSFLAEFPEVKTVPFLIIDGEKVYGYEPLRERYEQENNR